MKLDFPHPVPLPDDVRARALDAVLGELDAGPAPARRSSLMIAVAAVVAVLAVSVPVALSATGPDLSGPAALPGPAPDPASVDIRSPQGRVARCAAALATSADRAAYPPAADWSVTQEMELGSDTVLVVDDAFACHLAPNEVAISSTTTSPAVGPPGDGVSTQRLGGAVVALLNPQRRMLRVEVEGFPQPYSIGQAPLQVLLLPGPGPAQVTVGVDGGEPAPIPEPAAPAVEVIDRTLPVNRSGTDDERYLEICVRTEPFSRHSRPELWTPVLRRDVGGGAAPVLVGRIGDQYVGACVLTEDGPRFIARPMPAAEGTTSDPADRVPSTTVQLGALTGDPFASPAPGGPVDHSDCVVSDGVAVCASGPGTVAVGLLTGREDLRIAPVPGR